MFRFLRKSNTTVSPKAGDPFWATTQMLLELLRSSPACEESLAGHEWATLAEAGDPKDYDRLFRGIQDQDWQSLGKIRSFEGSKNAIIAKAIRCPKGKGSVFAYVDYVDLYSWPERGESELLTPAAWATLEASLPDLPWHSFTLAAKP